MTVDPTEIFGLRIARFAERVRARRAAPRAAAVAGEELLPRLKLLAGLVAGRPLEVRLTPEAGGWTGETLLLPTFIDAWGDATLNEAAYVYRTAYAAISWRLGVVGRSASPWIRQCETWLAVQGSRGELERSLPGAGDLAVALHQPLLDARPPCGAVRDGIAVSQTLCRVRLGGARPRRAEVHPAAHDWLERALAFDDVRAQRIHDLAEALFRALPPSRFLRHQAPVAVPLWGELLTQAANEEAPGADAAAPSRTLTKELDSRRVLGRVERRAARDRNRSPLFHHFEKIETLQDHDGASTRADESGDPEAERDALDQMRPSALVRTQAPSGANYRLDAMLDGPGWQVDDDAAAGSVHHYPEWHHRKRCYREDWCVLTEVAPERPLDGAISHRTREVLAPHRRRIEEMRRQLETLLLRRTIRRRQPDGSDVDLDAAVERYASLAAGHSSIERLYLDVRRTAQDLAVWILLDRSLSSDSWVAGVRILDVECETVLVLGEALDGLLDQVGVAAFSSYTRNRCQFLLIKDLGEPWSRVRTRVLCVEPAGYTRIGPAIRHATAKLAAVPARRRLLLVVTDGRPSDYDQYEGRYGIKDVAQAVREGRAGGILSYALAVEHGAEARLTEMFGNGHFRVLHSPKALPETVGEILMRLRA